MTNLSVIEGDLVSVHYTGTFDDGTIFDSSKQRGEPMTFTAGSEELILEFSKSVIGMNVGEIKKIKLDAISAYGQVNEELYRQVAIEQFNGHPVPEVGGRVSFQNENNKQIYGTVHLIEDDKIIIDFNHPMAGKDLNFEIELLNKVTTKKAIDYSALTLKELKLHAKKSGAKGYSKMRKAELVDLLKMKGDQVG